MTQQEQTISVLFKALSEIKDMGTTYPPFWEMYSAEQREQFPPHLTKIGKIAAQALSKVTQE